ncbi:hypothetical protein C8F01DRAFT_1255641 [Mycena amicta]|nr:hypothetical protein C8F01DRAFT_1255641 [Mycena amicta]
MPRPPCSLILLNILLLTTLLTPIAAQLRVGNLTHVLPQCQDVCETYDVMNTQCNAVGVFEITFIYCECTPRNLQIVLDCFDCQSVNATQQALMQDLLDDVVNTCNDRNGAPDSTLSVSSMQIVPSSSASSTPNSVARGHVPIPALRLLGGAAVISGLAGVLLVSGLS